jgi:cytochrome P450
MTDISQIDPTSVLDVDIFSDDTRQRWRELAVDWATRPPFYVVNFGIPQVVIGRYDDVREAFTSPDRITSTPPPASSERFDAFMGLPHIAVMNGPPHDRVRRILQPTFSSAGIERYGEAIETHINELLDEIEARGNEFDVIPDFSRKLIPRIMLGTMFGLDEEQQAVFIRMNVELEGVATSGGYPTAYVAAFEDARRVIDEMIAEREATPTDDFISMLIQGRDRGEPITDEEIFANVFAIGAAAMTTTSTTAAMTLYAWMRYRDQFEILSSQPALIPDAVEESLRCHPAGLFVFPRFAAVDTEIGGTPIPAGTPVHPCVAAANFDATHYPDPLRFDIRRQPKHIATFGFGGHFCAGAILARKILASSLRAFMSRYPDLALIDPDWAPVYHGQLGEIAPADLPMRLR